MGTELGAGPVPLAAPPKGRGPSAAPFSAPGVIFPLSSPVFIANSLPLKFKCCFSPFLTRSRNISLFI